MKGKCRFRAVWPRSQIGRMATTAGHGKYIVSDYVPTEERSRLMSGIRSKNTGPEIILRKGLHCLGYRYRLHCENLPGKPDITFPTRRAVILVHGCFWHAHSCHLFKWPKTRPEWWRKKISSNCERDIRMSKHLRELGWRQLIVWECAVKGKHKLPVEQMIRSVAEWIDFGTADGEILGSEM